MNKITDQSTHRIFSVTMPLILLSFMTSFVLIRPRTIEDAQMNVFDIYLKWKPRSYQNTPIRIIDIDDESLKKYGQWPWPRTLVAQLIEKLTSLGVQTIAFDIVFSEPDRTSPSQVSELISQTEINQPANHDLIFADAIKQSQVITSFGITLDQNDQLPEQKAQITYDDSNLLDFLAKFEGSVVNLPIFEEKAMGNGSFSVFTESDGMVRRIPLIFLIKDVLYPSLSLEIIRSVEGNNSYTIKTLEDDNRASFLNSNGILSIQVGKRTVPTDKRGRIWFYPTNHNPARWIPAWQVLSNEVKPEIKKDAIVFIGTSAMGLKDLRAIPTNPVTAGVEIQAQAAEQILLGNYLERPNWVKHFEFFYFLLTALFFLFLMPRIGVKWCALFAGSATIGLFCFAWYSFSVNQWLVDPVYPFIGSSFLFLVTSFASFTKLEAEKRQIRDAFARYLSPALANQLANAPEQLKLGGELKNISILFLDIHGFTTISERYNAEELTQFLNRFLTPMSDIVLKQKGTIDKYMGDSIMAFWNAPLSDPNHAQEACQAALHMRNYLIQWNRELKTEYRSKGELFTPIHIGIGINTGDCCVGNLGSKQRFDYSIVGDDVNLASRIEGQTRIYGVDIIIGENTHREAHDFTTIELDWVRVKGKNKSVRIYALLSGPDFKDREDFKSLEVAHHQLLEAYRTRKWNEALDLTQLCLKLDNPETRLRTYYRLFEKRIKEFQVHPPDAAWDGVNTAHDK
jgi:adenylate cyclase